MRTPGATIAAVHRDHWGRLLSTLVTRTRRLDLAEDALAEAFARASDRWPRQGVPANPPGWLYTTAWRLIVGSLRAEAMRGRKAPLLAVGPTWQPGPAASQVDQLDDERLALILLACHPALHPASRPALSLRLIVGTPTAEIARLFLVKTSTMAARITRAKRKIVAAGIPLARPVDEELAVRLDDVCRTIYLAFTAGYTPGTGPELLRPDLAGEAVELAAVLHRLVPDAPQVQALHGLLVLQHARRDARSRGGALVTLADQDRSLWHHEELETGRRLVAGVQPGGGYGEELRLQGLIATEHARAPTAEATDWTTIAELYQRLETVNGSPIVQLNRAVAVAEAVGPAAGLALLVGLDGPLAGNHRLHAVRGELAHRAGEHELAATSLAAAAELCTNDVECKHLTARLREVGAPSRRASGTSSAGSSCRTEPETPVTR